MRFELCTPVLRYIWKSDVFLDLSLSHLLSLVKTVFLNKHDTIQQAQKRGFTQY